jgi:radical SAM protein with 4Fe4S-binding SPASM domain
VLLLEIIVSRKQRLPKLSLLFVPPIGGGMEIIMAEVISYKDVYPQNKKVNIKANLDEAHSPFKVLAYPELIRQYTQEKEIRPMHIRVGITNACNIRCKFCNYHSENEKDFYDVFDYHDKLDTESLIRFFRDFAKDGGKAVTFCGSGEPTLHEGYKEMCYDLDLNGVKVGVITNGTLFNNYDLLKCVAQTHTWVRIGMNAGSAETYSKITGSPAKHFEYILNAIQYLKENSSKKDFRIGVNLVITLDNCEEIVLATQLAKTAGADYIRFEPEFYTELAHQTIYEKMDQIIGNLNAAKELEDEHFQVSIPKIDRGPMNKTEIVEGRFTTCHYSHFVTALGADGYIYPCPQIHLGAKYRMGNPIQMGYQEWRNSGQQEQWREEHPDRREFCKTCFYRPQNELLDGLMNGTIEFDATVMDFANNHPSVLHKEFV